MVTTHFVDNQPKEENTMANRKSTAQAEEQNQEAVKDTAIETPPAGERQPGDEPPEQAKRPFQPVRGWTNRITGPVQYRKFSDANLKIIAFKFNLPDNEKPPQEVLDVMHEHMKNKDGQPTGLRFQNTRTHGKVWTVPNDVEGLALADRIDFRLSELAQKMEETQGKGPF
jgi:hypothetical protein